jgi:hypothetical protein
MIEINQNNFFSFVNRYKNCHPLMILRTFEKTKSLGKAFDLLEDFSGKTNLIWDDKKNKWKEISLIEFTLSKMKKK